MPPLPLRSTLSRSELKYHKRPERLLGYIQVSIVKSVVPKANAELDGVFKYWLVPLKDNDPDGVGPEGEKTATPPLILTPFIIICFLIIQLKLIY
jgi:hypothetical protein